ncbi:hypothetical protein [Flavisolibacter tropicus]|uniref:Uncharacterized protein n=1 Tax=Flavisolibacter tropicus TaxID=1492898 RepID=A0A172TU97_9BACT|nr:hypothetical protein [Flavisolibacter tropicus]ANE50610.1 hypothetical protein SY85_08950 [Flavisolibacter tropicus]
MKQITALLMLTCLLLMTTIVVQASRGNCQKKPCRCIKKVQPKVANKAIQDVYVQPLFVFD